MFSFWPDLILSRKDKMYNQIKSDLLVNFEKVENSEKIQSTDKGHKNELALIMPKCTALLI
jgi:hypothetical protein